MCVCVYACGKVDKEGNRLTEEGLSVVWTRRRQASKEGRKEGRQACRQTGRRVDREVVTGRATRRVDEEKTSNRGGQV